MKIVKCRECKGKAKVDSKTVFDRIVCTKCGCSTGWFWDNDEAVLKNWNNWVNIIKPSEGHQ